MSDLLSAYRRTGADHPWSDPRAPHGTRFEGWYWRLTDVARRTVVVALCGLNRDALGRTWGTVGLAAAGPDVPPGFVAAGAVDLAEVDGDALRLGGDGPLRAHATPWALSLDAGPGAALRIALANPVGWPGRLGGVGLGHLVPRLSQYWHPHLLGADVQGHATVDGVRLPLDGAVAYAEKNWGDGFPRAWWWGQAHGFERPDVCVAFAGGEVGCGPLRTRATALVARVGDDVVRLGEPLLAPVRHELGPGTWTLRGHGLHGGEIELEGVADPAGGHDLPVPVPAMRTHVGGARQHLDGTVRVRVRRRGRTLFAGTSTLAGLERGAVVSSAAPWTSVPRSTTSSPAPSPRTSAPAM
jgi:hypothetical protein